MLLQWKLKIVKVAVGRNIKIIVWVVTLVWHYDMLFTLLLCQFPARPCIPLSVRAVGYPVPCSVKLRLRACYLHLYWRVIGVLYTLHAQSQLIPVIWSETVLMAHAAVGRHARVWFL